MAQTEQQMEMSGPGANRRMVKRRFWGRLRQRWKLLGVFEIDQQHDFYSLTCIMKEGLAAAVQNTIDNPIPNELSEDDYQHEVTQVHEDFTMVTFAGPVFASLRHSLGMTEKEYQHSLSSDRCYLQFISNSKSKADFFLTNDKRFFLKTQSKREVRFLLSHLKVYMKHMEKYPHSLLVKFLGVHTIRIPNQKKLYFVVMQSVFYPDERIAARYDIKGCQVSRWTDPSPEGSQVIIVLKDLNFEGQVITLGQDRSWLLRQVQIDTTFLRTLDVIDYSFLLAHQPLHQDERNPSLSFATLIMRTKKSVNACSSATGAALDDNLTLPAYKTKSKHGKKSTAVEPESVELQGFQAQNRRLLPNYKNPIHVIDGPEQRYFIGIIDIFTVYGFKKRLEHLWKKLRYPRQTFSTVSPSDYCQRLCQWVVDHTK